LTPFFLIILYINIFNIPILYCDVKKYLMEKPPVES